MSIKRLFLAIVMIASCVVANAQIDHTSHSADGSKFGFVDENEKWVIPTLWEYASWDDAVQVGIVGDFKGPRGAINAKGEFILPIKYAKIRTNPQSKTLMVAEEREGTLYWGVFDNQGKQIIPLLYKAMLYNRTKELFEATTSDNAKKLFSTDGSEVFPNNP